MGGTMTDIERSELRKLQDQVLKLQDTRDFIDRHGYDFPVFGPGSPTISELKQFIFPEYKELFEDLLQ
jgi:hypothetical protein